MTHSEHCRSLMLRIVQSPAAAMMLLSIALALIFVATSAAQAQTFTVLHNFGGPPPDGANPMAGLTIDAAGNLYGTTESGGIGYGSVFELKHTSSGFVYLPLYSFAGGDDGDSPLAKVTIGPNGSLYGTTYKGGGTTLPFGVGTVFNLQPQPSRCKATLCPWRETVLLRFNEENGSNPYSAVTFDTAGHLYGTADGGGDRDDGVVYELTPSNGAWTESLAYSFLGQGDGRSPDGAVIFDHAGNLYGTTRFGGRGYGNVYQLTPSGQSWKANSLYSFQGGADGGWPVTSLVMDNSGNLYGTTPWFPDTNNPGTVFQLAPSGGRWITPCSTASPRDTKEQARSATW